MALLTEKNPRHWRGSDLLVALYDELSRHFGFGEEETYETKISPSGDPADNWWRKRNLDPEHPLIGGQGTIMVQKLYGQFYFRFWSWTRYSDFPLIEISAGPQSAGIWAYGHGELIADGLDIKFSMDRVPLNEPILRIAGLIVFRASQLAQNPNRIEEKYWEVQRHPDRDYSSPSL